jgi:hypothetical protein
MVLTNLSNTTPDVANEAYKAALIKDKFMIALEKQLTERGQGVTNLNVRNVNKNRLPFDSWLLEHGFLECNLDVHSEYLCEGDEIHDVFARKNFDNTLAYADEAYEAIKPALRLATKLIQCPELTSWWIHIRLGKLRKDGPTGRWYLEETLEENDPMIAQHVLAETWQRLSNTTTIYWFPQDEQMYEKTVVFGINSPCILRALCLFDPVAGKHCHHPELCPLVQHIGLNTCYLYALLSPEARKGRTPCEEMRLQFLITKVLVHEIAHGTARLNREYRGEPFAFLNDLMPEMCVSWELYVFGAKINVTSNEEWLTTGRIGPLFSQFPPTGMSYPALIAPVSMVWIQEWFRKDTWEVFRTVKDYGLLDLPLACGQPAPFLASRYLGKNRGWDLMIYEKSEHSENYVVGLEGVSWSGNYVGLEGVSWPEPNIPVGIWFQKTAILDCQQAISDGMNTPKDFYGPWGSNEHRLPQNGAVYIWPSAADTIAQYKAENQG